MSTREDIIKLRDYYKNSMNDIYIPDVVKTCCYFKVQVLDEVLEHIVTE